MRNLLEIESSALQNADLIEGLQLNQIDRIQRAVSKNELSKINNSRKLSQIMLKSYEFFKESGKATLEESGVFWTAEDFGQKIFGFKKSYFMRMIKFGKLSDEQVEEFKNKCTELIQQGEKPSISVPNCLDYIKQQEQGGESGEATPRRAEAVIMEIKLNGKKIKISRGVTESISEIDAPIIKTDFDSGDLEELHRFISMVEEYLS
tara:strand:+ start:63 stop:680 length:618 start_codon:yes stop_codon:yes gene_type:complete